jgi:hypothetical protein
MLRFALVPLCLAATVAAASSPSVPAASGPRHAAIFRGRPVTYEVIDKRLVLEGDILLDHLSQAPGPRGVSPQTVGLAYQNQLWTKTGGVAVIPYIVTNAPSALATAINQFNTTFPGLIQFKARGSEANYVNFNFDSNDLSGTCESYVGMVGGEQEVTGSYACSLGTLLHEMGHVVGLFHEQSRSDRNTYVTFNYDNVIKGSIDNFNQLTDDAQNLTSYDFASIMHYIPYAFSRTGGPTLETKPAGIPMSNTVGYTASDIDGIERLYGAAPTNVTVTSNPAGLSVIVDGVSVTTPKTYSWALQSKHTLAVAAGGQMLNNAGYIYGRWADSKSASHNITLAPGIGSVGQPATSPAITIYTAHFIALSNYTAATAPAGQGGVAASPAPKSYAGLTGAYFVARQKVKLTPNAAAGYAFLTWGGTDAPWSANPKTTRVPDLGTPFNVTAYLTTQPITTITTNPAGAGFQVDGNYWYGPQNFASDFFPSWTAGSTHTLSTWSPQYPYSINSRMAFLKWSDGGKMSHSITVPTGASTITGSFRQQYVPVAYAQPGCAATVSFSPSSSTGFYDLNTELTLDATTASGWTLTGWLYDLAGQANPQTLKVTGEELAIADYDTTATPLTIASLAPARKPSGTSNATVTINGTGFTASSIVFVNNIYRSSTYVGPQQIKVKLTASDMAQPGAFPIGVSNFPSGAPCSAYQASTFTILNSPPP